MWTQEALKVEEGATSQGIHMASGSWKRQRNRKEIDSPFEPPKRHTALLILDFNPVKLTLDF